VTRHQTGAGGRDEQLFEALDPFEVEVVRRLVEDQQVGFEGERPGEGEALPPAAREGAGRTLDRLEPEAAEGPRRPGVALGIVERKPGERREDRCLDRRAGLERRVLLDEGDARRLADRACPGIGLLDPGDDPEQRRLAGAVRTDEADPVAAADTERDPGEERSGAELLADRIAGEKGRRGYNATSRRSRMSALPARIVASCSVDGAPTRWIRATAALEPSKTMFSVS
jgi:hypothetical protein